MLTILHTESSMGWGGQEIRIFQESLGMIKRGHRVIIAAPEESSIFKRSKEACITTFPACFNKMNPLSIVRMVSLIDREKVDIVNTHSSSDSWVTTLAARFSRARIIRTRHLSTVIGRSYLSRLIYDVLPDAVITTGEAIRQKMIRDNDFTASKIFSIPTGVDTERFDLPRVKPVLDAGSFKVGTVGVLRSWKGHQFFLEAVPEIWTAIPGAVFYIVGDGPQREHIRSIIRERSLQGRVHMLDHREDIPEIIASLDVVVHPSYGHEGVPQTLLQALAMEKPVVASDAGAIKEIVINSRTGFLIEPRNPKQIAERVIELHRRPELRTEFGKAGRRLVEERYSFEKMLDSIENLYNDFFKHVRTS